MPKTDDDIKKKFLLSYQLLEKAISDSSMPSTTVYEYTDTMLDSKDQNKMHLCRNVRNFLVHEPEDFVLPSQEMINYLDAHRKKIEMTIGYAKDVMTAITPLKADDSISDAARKLSRYCCVPYVDDNGALIGLVTDTVIRKAVVNESLDCTVKEIEKYLEKAHKFIKPDMPSKSLSINQPVQIVTDNGKKDGRYKGVVFINHIGG